ncbi:hypothetical protein DOM22_05515 [Bdellovibrio sp. ZAP7]|uniref:hypothetical protein n=1 Tax=Bdellovibrio sp. ZAP7 TaxID=2231053 RepID=UPI0011586633|nr:hypothetical protein [Bdellovibrio sp. ZAP7]QDK44656.1 hypothetical protein DOM22_05515 [Bdellovibrio sp. ZAP7]
MKKIFILAAALIIGLKISSAFADLEKNKKVPNEAIHAEHDSSHDGDADKKDEKPDRSEKAEEYGHGEREEEGSNVGPDKGITVADEHDGIKLSDEAEKNFELKIMTLIGNASWEVPVSALLTSGEEINIYRVRNGFYKRIDFDLISKNATHMKISSKDLAKGDGVVTSGVGFLRTAELAASGGASEEHGH